nr:MAG TPA: hypothetical protein [Caudoviricetes sp.]
MRLPVRMIVLAWHNQKKGPNSQLGIPSFFGS